MEVLAHQLNDIVLEKDEEKGKLKVKSEDEKMGQEEKAQKEAEQQYDEDKAAEAATHYFSDLVGAEVEYAKVKETLKTFSTTPEHRKFGEQLEALARNHCKLQNLRMAQDQALKTEEKLQAKIDELHETIVGQLLESCGGQLEVYAGIYANLESLLMTQEELLKTQYGLVAEMKELNNTMKGNQVMISEMLQTGAELKAVPRSRLTGICEMRGNLDSEGNM